MEGGPERPTSGESREALEARIRALEAENAELRERNEYLESVAGIDALTGVSNRHLFDPELDRTMKLVRGEIEEHRAGVEAPKVASLIFVDLDHFKQLNDTHGHPAGDEVLRRVAALMEDAVREHETDIVARVGGEELVILMPGANEEIAARRARKIKEDIAQLTFADYPDVAVTTSIGVASSEHATDAKALYANADQALYAAKEGGRNEVVVYSSL